ncbi:MAG: hypothetical protein ACO331_09195 [Prochlorothrix sp.]
MPLLSRPLTCNPARSARSLLATLGLAWATLFATPLPSLAQDAVTPAPAAATAAIDLDQFCRFPELARAQKESLRSAMIDRNTNRAEYIEMLGEHALLLHQCREQEWPQKQALWIRLYPCDLKPGRLEQIFDRIVNQGYNQVYVEVFYDGRVLLPKAQNPTVWPSVLNEPGQENIDLFALAIAAGRQRGLEVYGWMFTMNFGYSYASRPDRQEAIARNAQGQSSLDLVSGEVQVFIDPYNSQAQWDYRLLVESMLQRRPDGLLFDYIRYPRGDGAASVVSRVQDLLIHTPAARQSLLNRALNGQGRDLISRFLQKGHVGVWDVTDVAKRYPLEPEPLWEGRQPRFQEGKSLTAALEQPWLQQDLWLLSVAHAQRGILDFLGLATQPVQAAGIPAGAVFFPGANRTVGQQGFDSRLQPWNQFPSTLEWHPMAYSTCQGTDCIVAEVERVLALASPDTWVQPALAGTWGDSLRDRPSLEAQMLALKAATPQLPAVSHFAYSWQYPQDDQSRKFCTR